MEVKAFLRKMMKYRQWNKLQETDDDYRWLYEMFNPHDWKVTLKSHNNLRALKLTKTLKAISPVASSPTYMYTRTLNNRLWQACRSNALSQCLVRKCFRNKGETNISRYSTRTIFFFQNYAPWKESMKVLGCLFAARPFSLFYSPGTDKVNIIAEYYCRFFGTKLRIHIALNSSGRNAFLLRFSFDLARITRKIEMKPTWEQEHLTLFQTLMKMR